MVQYLFITTSNQLLCLLLYCQFLQNWMFILHIGRRCTVSWMQNSKGKQYARFEILNCRYAAVYYYSFNKLYVENCMFIFHDPVLFFRFCRGLNCTLCQCTSVSLPKSYPNLRNFVVIHRHDNRDLHGMLITVLV